MAELGKAILMHTHNICFYIEIWKITPRLLSNPPSPDPFLWDKVVEQMRVFEDNLEIIFVISP